MFKGKMTEYISIDEFHRRFMDELNSAGIRKQTKSERKEEKKARKIAKEQIDSMHRNISGSYHGGSCFPSGTNILVAIGRDFTIRPIESFDLRDKIACFDYKTEKFVEGVVERVDIAEEPTLKRIKFSDKDCISCSLSQRLYRGDKQWIRTASIEKGIILFRDTKIVAVENYEWRKDVYSFVVKPFDNFVIAVNDRRMIAHDNSS